MRATTLTVAAVAMSLCLLQPDAAHADWDPERFAEEGTLELLTVGADQDEHWFPVWLVVLDGEVYIRLGNRAADRIESNTRAPLVSVRIAGEEFASVRAEAVPEMAERVAEAMADKYFIDILIRFFPHPLTMRLVPTVREARAVGAAR